MRLQLEFGIDNFPISYRLGVLSIIKEMIRKGSASYYEKIFEINKKQMKPFGYAVYFPNLETNDYEIETNRLILTVSSPSYEFMMHLTNGSGRLDEYNYQNYKLTLLRKHLLPNPPSFSSIVTFKTLSPLLIENKEKKPLLANDSRFEEECNYFANLLIKEMENRHLLKPIKILRSNMKKIVVKENLHQVQPTPIFLTANQGYLQMQGHPDDLKLLYDLGFGRRRSLGFGLLEVEEVTNN